MVDRPKPARPAIINGPVPKTELTQAGWFAAVIMWFGVVFVLGTIGGIWIKLFWMGWVFAP